MATFGKKQIFANHTIATHTAFLKVILTNEDVERKMIVKEFLIRVLSEGLNSITSADGHIADEIFLTDGMKNFVTFLHHKRSNHHLHVIPYN